LDNKAQFEAKMSGEGVAKYITGRVDAMGHLAHSPGAQRLIFSAFIEEVALSSLPVELIPSFILHCLPH